MSGGTSWLIHFERGGEPLSVEWPASVVLEPSWVVVMFRAGASPFGPVIRKRHIPSLRVRCVEEMIA